jgi:hypothetical protein
MGKCAENEKTGTCERLTAVDKLSLRRFFKKPFHFILDFGHEMSDNRLARFFTSKRAQAVLKTFAL